MTQDDSSGTVWESSMAAIRMTDSAEAVNGSLRAVMQGAGLEFYGTGPGGELFSVWIGRADAVQLIKALAAAEGKL